MDGIELLQHWRNDGCTLRVVKNPELPPHLRVREIIAVFTEPEQRNKGFASDLIKEVCDEADKRAIVLLLKPEKYGKTGGHKDLKGFYEKFGFKKIQDKPVLMARPITYNPKKKIIAELISG